MLLSVIIVNYNVKYFLEQCLYSVIKALKHIDGEIIVIDNHSNDGSYSFFKNRFPEVQFVWNEHNLGFARANNQALTFAWGEYVLFLNPDTIVPEDCFEKCIGFIKQLSEGHKKTCCALGIKMLDGSGNFLRESKRAFPSPFTSLYKLFGLASLFPRSKRFGKYYLGHLNDNENHEVDVLAGAFMMVPKYILNEMEGFDENFFMYGEDIDLSYRIQKAGYKIWYFAESCIIHFKGESTKKGSLNYVKIFYKAMSIFVKKHYEGNRAGLFIFFIHMAIFIRACFSVVARLTEWKIVKGASERDKYNQVGIVGNCDEYRQACDLMKHAGRMERVIGRIDIGNEKSPDTVGLLSDIKKIVQLHSLKEIIFCEGQLSFKKFVETISLIPNHVSIQLFSRGSHAIIGSNDKDVPGNFVFWQ